MTLDEMFMALEFGPIEYGTDDDYIQVPVQTANKIAAALRAGQAMRAAAGEVALSWDTATKGEK